MKNLAYYNGAVGEMTDMPVPFCDRVCFFGDGVYDAAYSRNGKVFTLDEHVDRLFFSGRRVGIVPSLTADKLSSLIRSLVTRCDENECFVYFQLTRGISVPRSHVPVETKSNLWITVTPKKVTPRGKTFDLMTYPDERYGYCFVKTLNLIPNVLAATRAKENDCDEAIFVEDGLVNECAHSNIHILKNGELITPPPGRKTLGGIARKHLIAACRAQNVAVTERKFSVEEMFSSDEVFVTSAGTFLAPAKTIDGKKVGGGATLLTEKLTDLLYGEFYAATD